MSEYTYKKIEFNHPKNEQSVFQDLLMKYKKFGTLYIGVDFDNTILPYGMEDIFEEETQEEPDGILMVIQTLRWAKLLGMKLCLWTLPESDENLEWKIQWCDQHGINMDYINESPLLPEYSKKYPKQHFNLLLDDVAGLESAFNILYNLCECIQSEKDQQSVSKLI